MEFCEDVLIPGAQEAKIGIDGEVREAKLQHPGKIGPVPQQQPAQFPRRPSHRGDMGEASGEIAHRFFRASLQIDLEIGRPDEEHVHAIHLCDLRRRQTRRHTRLSHAARRCSRAALSRNRRIPTGGNEPWLIAERFRGLHHGADEGKKGEELVHAMKSESER
jgi:hypothetical protein